MNVRKVYLGVTISVPTLMAVMSVAVGMVTTSRQIAMLVMVSTSLLFCSSYMYLNISLCFNNNIHCTGTLTLSAVAIMKVGGNN